MKTLAIVKLLLSAQSYRFPKNVTQRQIGLKAVVSASLPWDLMHFDEDKVNAFFFRAIIIGFLCSLLLHSLNFFKNYRKDDSSVSYKWDAPFHLM